MQFDDIYCNLVRLFVRALPREPIGLETAIMDEGGRRSSLSLDGYVGWSYAGAGWVIAVVDPDTNTLLTTSVVTLRSLPRLMRPIGGRRLEVINGLVFTHVGNYGQTTYQVLPALREAIPTHLGRSIVWGHDPHLQYRL